MRFSQHHKVRGNWKSDADADTTFLNNNETLNQQEEVLCSLCSCRTVCEFSFFFFTQKCPVDVWSSWRRSHLIDGRLLYEAWSVCRQQTMRGHDINLIGPSLFQDLCGSNEVSHIIYDIILKEDSFFSNNIDYEVVFWLQMHKILKRHWKMWEKLNMLQNKKSVFKHVWRKSLSFFSCIKLQIINYVFHTPGALLPPVGQSANCTKPCSSTRRCLHNFLICCLIRWNNLFLINLMLLRNLTKEISINICFYFEK